MRGSSSRRPIPSGPAALSGASIPARRRHLQAGSARIGDHSGAFPVAIVPEDDFVEIEHLQALAILAACIVPLIGSSVAWCVGSTFTLCVPIVAVASA